MMIQLNATEQYFPVVPLCCTYKMFLAFESIDEIPKCDYSDQVRAVEKDTFL